MDSCLTGGTARLTRIGLLVTVALGAAACDGSQDETNRRVRKAAPRDSTWMLRDSNVTTARPKSEPPAVRDWAQIKARDTLTALVSYNSTTYFIYKGEPMGYEYELLKEFAKDHELALKLIVVQHRDSLVDLLRSGRGDLVASRLIPLPEDTGRVLYTRALYRTDPVVVQRKAPPAVAIAKLPKAADTLLKAGPADPQPPVLEVRARLVQNPADLAGKRVMIPKRSPERQSLLELSDSISGEIHVVEVESSPEGLIKDVAKGDIDFTVAQGNLAQLQGAAFKNLLFRPIVGASKKVSWALQRYDRVLLDTLNAWIADEKRGPLFDRLYKKYFVDARAYLTRAGSRYLTSETGTLSPFDSLLKEYAPHVGWDWRLLGSQMYQESRFQPNAKSWAGAVGLLQLMPGTARQVGIRNPRDPVQNVRGAVKYLGWLEDRWAKNVTDSTERLKFILASYNAGSGHIEDAQRLAAKHRNDPKRWDEVAYWVLQLSQAESYNDPVVKFGFCRGLEPVTYVSIILDRFDHYKQFVVTRAASIE